MIKDNESTRLTSFNIHNNKLKEFDTLKDILNKNCLSTLCKLNLGKCGINNEENFNKIFKLELSNLKVLDLSFNYVSFQTLSNYYNYDINMFFIVS
jgi:hypothetical protein